MACFQERLFGKHRLQRTGLGVGTKGITCKHYELLMTHKYLQIAGQKTLYAFDEKLSNLGSVAPKANTIILTDENVQQAHGTKWKGYKAIVVPAGEPHKQQSTIDGVIARLMDYGADRTTTLVGIGGGVVTDMAGYAASVYMRGIRVGLVPTSILAMVDAAIGGKNGVDVGPYKNLVGTIRQPDFLWFD
ncbi:MAG TPA: hypothetical protein PKD90_05730, partial [Phnomibacter sp.]|nr:hypothetical protein [Phnomibacter sp.]